jgi:hypothetical protein
MNFFGNSYELLEKIHELYGLSGKETFETIHPELKAVLLPIERLLAALNIGSINCLRD